MINWPTIAKATTSYTKLLGPLTVDDQFLIDLNKLFSGSANTDGHANQPRGYDFDLRISFDKVQAPKVIQHGDLDSIVRLRSEGIVKSGKPLNVFWSGGIDSTLVVAAILPQVTYKDQIKIYHTCESIRENPFFFDYINSFGVETVMWSDAWVNDFPTRDILVTGTSADEITGSLDRSFYEQYNKWLSDPWEKFFKFRGKDSAFIDRCTQIFEECPVEIKTTFDARWWFYFYIRHTNFARRDWDYGLEGNFSNNIQFFNSPEFDSWSMQNIDSMIGKEYRSYKQAFKDATAVYWKNDNYLLNKEKTNSFLSVQWVSKKMALKQQHYLFIYKTTDGQFKTFRPDQYPFVSRSAVIDMLGKI